MMKNLSPREMVELSKEKKTSGKIQNGLVFGALNDKIDYHPLGEYVVLPHVVAKDEGNVSLCEFLDTMNKKIDVLMENEKKLKEALQLLKDEIISIKKNGGL